MSAVPSEDAKIAAALVILAEGLEGLRARADASTGPTVDISTVGREFSVSDLCGAILDTERTSMRYIQAELTSATDVPSTKLVKAFTLVGRNLRDDVVVRAGVKLANDYREHFPERRLNPYATWRTFVQTQLRESQVSLMNKHTSADLLADRLVSGGLAAWRALDQSGLWHEAPERMAGAARSILDETRSPIDADN
jgi:hypothetical protein